MAISRLLVSILLLSSAGVQAQPTASSSPGSGPAATVLQLRGGDRITGTITAEDSTRVIVSNKWSKEIVVPLAEISKREPLSAKPSEAKPAGPAMGSLTYSAVRPGTAAVSGPLPSTKPKSTHHWAGEAQFGADLVLSERKRQLYSGRFKVSYGYNQFKNVFDYNFAYGKTDGLLSDNRMAGFAKTDFDLDPRLYVYNLGGAGYDQIRKIDLRYEFGPGVGYRAVKLTNFVLNTECGINYQAQYQSDDTQTELFFFRLAENAAWAINGRFSVDEKFEFFPRVDEWEKYRFRFESNLRYALLGNLAFVVTVLDQYDTQPALNVMRNDLQLRSSVSLKF
jgi:hypothetical protein